MVNPYLSKKDNLRLKKELIEFVRGIDCTVGNKMKNVAEVNEMDRYELSCRFFNENKEFFGNLHFIKGVTRKEIIQSMAVYIDYLIVCKYTYDYNELHQLGKKLQHFKGLKYAYPNENGSKAVRVEAPQQYLDVVKLKYEEHHHHTVDLKEYDLTEEECVEIVNYYVSKIDIQKLFEQAKRECLEANIPISPAIDETVEIKGKVNSVFGTCHRERTGEGYKFYIKITKMCLQQPTKFILNTLIHELIHTCDGSFNHGTQWKQYAEIMNKKYGYFVSRTNEGMLGRDINSNYKYELYCSKCDFVEKMLKRSKTIQYPHRYLCPKCGNPSLNSKAI